MRMFLRGMPALALSIGLALAGAACPTFAQETAGAGDEAPQADNWSPSFALHGFGNTAYGKTNGNTYTVGTKDGNYQESEFSLNLSAEPIQNLAIHAQVSWAGSAGGDESNVDYAFAEWRFSDAIRLRLGQGQPPFGIYTEIFDVGTLRPFTTLPQSIYGPVGIVAEGYKGVGLTGFRTLGAGWGLSYDVYGGGLSLTEQDAIAVLSGDSDNTDIVRDVVGGRVIFEAPGNDLSFGLSAVTGTNDKASKSRNSSIGAHVQVLTEKWLLRAEAVNHDDQGERQIRAGYVELGRFLSQHWQVAARYERMQTSLTDRGGLPQGLFDHREAALGVNYWFNSHVVIKLSVHDIKGNAFARPQDQEGLSETLANGTLDPKTRMVSAGFQFSF